MQSAAPPPGSGSEDPWWKKPGYYLWLLAIGAIVYAYVFATSSIAQTTNKGVNTGMNTGAPTVNVGNQVFLLLGCILIYMFITKMWTNGQYELLTNANLPTWIVPVVNAVITFGLLLGLVFVSILATQSNVIMNSQTADDSKGFFGSNVTLIGLIIISMIGRILYIWRYNLNPSNATMSFISNMFLQSSQFVLNFWFPLVMMYYFIRVGTSYWFQIVSGVSLSITILMMCYNWWKISTQQVPITPAWETFKQMAKDVWNSFPISPYLKYVENTDIMDVAKRGMIFALLAYVAYLMISVYKFKHTLIPCIGTDFASCFGLKGSNYSSNDTPYVNALFWTLIISVGVNALNWILQLVSVYTRVNNWANGTTVPEVPINFTAERAMQLLKLLVFPFYWLIKMFVQYPVATIVAFIAFAALGLLLYRSSFDLTSFVDGQRGTVITMFTMFIASLLIFGVYSMNSSTTEMVEGNMSYGQFIGKIGMVIAIAVCVVGLLLYFLNSHSKLVSLAGIFQYGITALIYITGIAIVIGAVRTLFSTSRKMGDSMFQVSLDGTNWVINILKLIGNLLFYLPCLMLDFADTMKEQYGLTMRPWLILLGVEAAFILAGHLLPSVVAKAINHTGVQILSAPISMTTATPITTHDIQFVNAHGVDVIPTPTANPDSGVTATTVLLRNYNYGVSAWFYIHPQPPNTNANYDSDAYTNMMQFGSFGPSVQYNPKTNTLQFSIYGKTIELPAKVPLTVSDIPLQTWNNVIINSDKGAVDIFINNKLIYTGNHVPDNDTDANAVHNVTIGNADGTHGEICNVVLNTSSFTKAEIEWLYKTNKMLNPPVVGVNMDPLNQGDSESYLASKSVDIKTPLPTPMPTYSTYGMNTFGVLGAIFGAIFGWLFNDANTMSSTVGLFMGAIVFGLIGALLGAVFSTDGTVAYVLKTVANVFVDTF